MQATVITLPNIVPVFDIQAGRCAVVEDAWENRLVLLDMRKGALITDADGTVLGNAGSPGSG